jgi:hypothetical protein
MWLRRTHRRFTKKLILAVAVAATVVPAATAGTDTGIGIPAGRDVVYASHPVVSENGLGQHFVAPSVPLVTENSRGQNPIVRPSSSASLVSENGAGQNPVQVDPYLAALQIRSEALDRRYGLAPASSASLVSENGAGQNPVQVDPYLAALQIRSQALDRRYGLAPATSAPKVLAASSGDSFDWAKASIIAAAAFGAMLMAMGAVFATRRHRATLVH